MQRLLYILCLLLFVAYNSPAQTATGSWYGKADVELAGMHNNYLTELVLKQKGNRVDGIFGYYFRDKYQSFFVHGRYNPKTREVIIENIPIIYFNSNSTVNSIDCNTNFIAVIIHSKVKSSLKGAFYHDARYKYMCPDLKVNYTLDRTDQNQDSVLKAGISDAKIWRPQVDDVVVDMVKTVEPAKAAVTADAGAKDPVAAASSPTPAPDTTMAAKVLPPVSKPDTASMAVRRADSIANAAVAVANEAAAESARAAAAVITAKEEENKKIAASFAGRKEVLSQVLEVESDSVRLSFYDNGEIDGDSISVFINKRVVLTHQELAAKALNVYLRLDSTLNDTEISMFAENLGKYPPNTALMVVTDGKHRYEVYMSSSLTENSTIQLKRKKKP